MKTLQARTMNLAGTSYDIGFGLGKMYAEITPLKALHTQHKEGFGDEQVKESADLFERWCPGLTEELHGFADALEVQPKRLFYYAMTYLLPRCSQIALLPSITAESKPLVARNYEFSHEAEDFCLIKTDVKGKFMHLGTSVLSFGRDDGLNEYGLSVTQSSCGFPVGAMPYMRAPALKGFQFWAVIRGLLENCKDVGEAIAYLEGMPIAYNMNLLLADKAGHAALFETFDGRSAFKRIGPDTGEQYLFATNHAVLPDIIPREPEIMIHSAKRYEYIYKNMREKTPSRQLMPASIRFFGSVQAVEQLPKRKCQQGAYQDRVRHPPMKKNAAGRCKQVLKGNVNIRKRCNNSTPKPCPFTLLSAKHRLADNGTHCQVC